MKSNWELFREEILDLLSPEKGQFAEEIRHDVEGKKPHQTGTHGHDHSHEAEFSSGMTGGAGGRISSDFGTRIHPISGKEKHHNGTDISGLPQGAKAYAVADAEVMSAGYAGSAGNMVRLQFVEGEDVHEYLYMHLDSVAVNRGDFVKKNQVVGVVGNTGGSTGRHLHLEHKVNGRPVRPSSNDINTSVQKVIE